MRRLLALVVVAVVFPASAAAATTSYAADGTILVDGRRTFPIALLRPPPLDGATPWGTGAWDEVARAGVNLVSVGPFGGDWTDAALAEAKAWNAAAQARGIHTWVNLRELARAQPGTPEESRLRAVVETLRADPGLALWKGADEPWWNGWPASSLAHAYALTKALDPAHLSLVIQAPRGTAEDLRPYDAVTDVASVDVYPVRFGVSDPDLHAVGRWTSRLHAIAPHKPVLTTLQICWSSAVDRAGSGAYVLPTRRQARYMAYDAILNGARGLIFFGGHSPGCLDARDAGLGWNWRYWDGVLEGLVRELGRESPLHPALLRPSSALRVRSRDPGVTVEGRLVGRELWVIAARQRRGTAPVRLSGLPGWASRGAVYREGRIVRARNGAFTDRFSRWDVHVYRFRRD